MSSRATSGTRPEAPTAGSPATSGAAEPAAAGPDSTASAEEITAAGSQPSGTDGPEEEDDPGPADTGPADTGPADTGAGGTGAEDPDDYDQDGFDDEDGDVALVSLDDADDDLIDRTEPIELAEPVEDMPPRRRRPRLLLVFGCVVLAAAIVGGAIAIVGSVTHGFKKPVKITYEKSAVFSLKTGECLDPRGQQSYTLIACGSPHDDEVFATFALTGTKWPGGTVAAAQASAGCASRLTSYLNPDLAISLASTYVFPDQVAWQAGTRTVICEVHAASGPLTGSVRSAAAGVG